MGGIFNVTMDFAQGEFDYNPFITDVGALGVMFSGEYQVLLKSNLEVIDIYDRFSAFDSKSPYTGSFPRQTHDPSVKRTFHDVRSAFIF